MSRAKQTIDVVIVPASSGDRLTPRMFIFGIIQQLANICLNHPIADIAIQPLSPFVENHRGTYRNYFFTN